MTLEEDEEGKVYKWEITPHPYDESFDFMLTDSDAEALEAVKRATEMLWDCIGPGEERTIKVRRNNV